MPLPGGNAGRSPQFLDALVHAVAQHARATGKGAQGQITWRPHQAYCALPGCG